jgi:hypothetical protein
MGLQYGSLTYASVKRMPPLALTSCLRVLPRSFTDLGYRLFGHVRYRLFGRLTPVLFVRWRNAIASCRDFCDHSPAGRFEATGASPQTCVIPLRTGDRLAD